MVVKVGDFASSNISTSMMSKRFKVSGTWVPKVEEGRDEIGAEDGRASISIHSAVEDLNLNLTLTVGEVEDVLAPPSARSEHSTSAVLVFTAGAKGWESSVIMINPLKSGSSTNSCGRGGKGAGQGASVLNVARNLSFNLLLISSQVVSPGNPL